MFPQIVKIFEIAPTCFQITCSGRTYVGDRDYMNTIIQMEGVPFYEFVELVGSPVTLNSIGCSHQYVDMGFRFHDYRCKFCDQKKI